MFRVRPQSVVRLRGFSLIDMLMTVSILGILTAVSLPLMVDNERHRLRAASSILISDMEFAQMMTISHPQDPVVMVFASPTSYRLAHASTPGVPLRRADTDAPYIVRLGNDRASVADGVQLHLSNLPDSTIRFSPYGGLTGHDLPPRISILQSTEPESRRILVAIDPMTGTITETLQFNAKE